MSTLHLMEVAQTDAPMRSLHGKRFWPTVVVCAILHVLFAIVAWTASTGKCATADEPVHAMAAWTQLRFGDFRIDPEGSSLWKYWAAIPDGRAALHVDWSDSEWAHPKTGLLHTPWLVRVLYQTSGNDGAAFVQRSRGMMLVIGVALGVLISVVAARLDGAFAALAATALYCLDPNFLGHAPLVKNDVPFTLAMFAAVAVAWRVGKRATVFNIALLALLCGVGVTVKFSGIGLIGIVFVLLGVRAVLPWPWSVLGRELRGYVARLTVAAAIGVACALVTYGVIWASYGFRYAPTGDNSFAFDRDGLLSITARLETFVQHPERSSTDEEVRSWRPGSSVRAILFAEDHKLLPNTFLHGLLYTRVSVIARRGFLCGQYSITGWWYYFPLAILFKTPLATLLAMLATFIFAMRSIAIAIRTRARHDYWTWLCLGVPVLIYSAAAMSSNLNLGLRHMFPIYPFLFITCGVVVAKLNAICPLKVRAVGVVLLAGLAAETLVAYPNYIPFFNAPSAAYGRIRLLGDSNLDWGQDLPLLAKWQKEHPERKLFLCYFGTVHPAFYGIKYTPLPGSIDYKADIGLPQEPGVWAISAFNLQGILMTPAMREFYGQFLERKPLAVLGESIYLYEVGTAIKTD